MSKKTAIFLNGGAGRMISSIPAVEKYLEENPEKDPILVCEGGTDAFKGHPKLYFKAYDSWHKNLFQELLKDRELISPEPYRIWEYYNQKCSLAQAYDIAINNKGIRDLPKPTIRLSKEELLMARKMIAEVKDKTGKDKIVVVQPFGRSAHPENLTEKQMKEDKQPDIADVTGRSIELKNVWSIVRKLSKKYGVMMMSEFPLEFKKHMSSPVATPMNVHIRIWMAVIKQANHFVGCDSVGQHIAYAFNGTSTVLIGSTYPVNTSFPDSDNVDIIDLGLEDRVYSPIRITSDEFSDRTNEGIMAMDDQSEDKVIKSVEKMLKHSKNKQ
jgi:hypothetical protein|tara:strand:+ start:6129 stop:7109 length:981 start_codon:yes stop_codon:yes gene_type:complete